MAQKEEEVSKDQLQLLIQQLEQRLANSNQAPAIEDEKVKEKLRKQRQLQLKLRQERRRMEQVLEEKRRQEEELIDQQRQFSSLQEEVEEQRKVIEQLKRKYRQAQSEVKDLEGEHEFQKEELLENVRDQVRELEFCQEVIKTMLRDHELAKLRQKAKYDENNGKWVLPPFFIKEKEVHLPKIRNAQALVDAELDKRDIVFDEEAIKANGPKQEQGSKREREMNGTASSKLQAVEIVRQSRVTPIEQQQKKNTQPQRLLSNAYFSFCV